MKNAWIRRLCSGSLMLLAIVFLAGCGDDDDGAVVPVTHSISGQVTSSGTGLSGVTMALSGAGSATATTDAGGNYTFAGLANGSYTVTPSRTGYSFSPTDNTQTVSGANITGVNFIGTATVVSAVLTKVASLDNTQETTSSTSTGRGGGILTVDTTTGNASGFVMSTGVLGTAAHIHSAARGVPGGVIVPLVGGPDIWVVPDNTTLSATNVTAFQNGNLYYNIHSAAFPDGEIRGQIDMTPTAIRFASLDNTQETPPTNSTAKGGGFLAVDTATGKAAGFSVSTGVTGTASHIHSAARGVPGGVIVPLVGGPSHWFVPDNTTLSGTNVTAFQNGNLYYNIHSAAFPDGEIRGQIDMTATAVEFASLDNTQETPPTNSTAKGGGFLAVDTATGKAAGFSVSTGVTGTASHIHSAARGVPGGVIVPLVGGPSHWFVPDNTTLSGTNVTAFQNGNLYYNIHSAAFPDGEIRGQIDSYSLFGPWDY